MAYLGNAPARSFISFERQVFTIVNSQTAYTLSHSVTNENDIRLVINNIVQEPGSGKAYTASGTTLTLSAALTNGTDEMYCVFLGRAVATNKPGAGSVGTTELAADAVTGAKIADDAISDEHLDPTAITGQTELATAPASTDELLISDAGVLKRVDVSLISGTNTPHFEAYRSGQQAISNGSWVTVVFNAEQRDASSIYDTSNGRFTPTTAGKYFVYANIIGGNDGASTLNYVLGKFYKNGSDYQTTSVFKQDSRGYPGSNYTVSMCHVIEFNGSSDYLEVKINMDTTVGSPDCVENSNFGAYKIIE